MYLFVCTIFSFGGSDLFCRNIFCNHMHAQHYMLILFQRNAHCIYRYIVIYIYIHIHIYIYIYIYTIIVEWEMWQIRNCAVWGQMSVFVTLRNAIYSGVRA